MGFCGPSFYSSFGIRHSSFVLPVLDGTTHSILSAAADQFTPAAPAAQKIRETKLKRLVRGQAMKRNAKPATDFFHSLAMFRQPALVIRPHSVRIQIKVAPAFNILEQHRVVEIKGQFIRIEHLKQHGPSDRAFDWQTASAQLWKTARCAPSETAA